MKVRIKRALISVSNKEGIVDFAKTLEEAGVEIISTGGTYRKLKESGIKVKKVGEVTGSSAGIKHIDDCSFFICWL